MGGEGDLLSRVRVAAALLDDEALAALASKGLVRRARKDLEASPPRLVGEREGRIRLDVEEWTVDVAERPADSRCSCPARGVCRHLVAALLHLAIAPADDSGAPAPAVAPCGDQILGVTDDALRRFAGRALVKRALGALASGLEVACEDGAPFVARAPAWGIECRFFPGGGLEGMLCSCHEPGACVHKVAAVIAWQARAGRRDLAREDPVLAEAEGAPRSRDEVRAAVSRTLEEIVALGVSRLSPAAEGRLRTLATSAHGVDLPRFERLLAGLADEVAAWLRRDAQASSEAILARAAQAAALAAALEHPTPERIGRHRTRYERVGDLELVGLGARAWRTRSGYVGLTAYFWDPRGARFATWTDARPSTAAAFDPVARFRAPGPWAGCDSPAHAAASRIRLLGAFRSQAGRLSGREATRALVLGPSDPVAVPGAIGSWAELVPLARRLFGAPLAERDELGALVLLRPRGWGAGGFDSVRQEMRVDVLDDDGRALPLVLAHSTQTRAAIDALEAAAHRPVSRVLGALRLERGRLAVDPVSLVAAGRVESLGLGTALAAAGASVPSPSAEEDEAAEVEAEVEAAFDAGPIGALLAAAMAELERLAEAGGGAWRPDGAAALRARADAMGLSTVARALDGVVAAPAAADETPGERMRGIARACLRAAYVVRLAAALGAVEAATSVYAASSSAPSAD